MTDIATTSKKKTWTIEPEEQKPVLCYGSGICILGLTLAFLGFVVALVASWSSSLFSAYTPDF